MDGERTICMKHGDPGWPDYGPDPDAPSVSEVVEVLMVSADAMRIIAEQFRHSGTHYLARQYQERANQAKDMIARLDGGET